MNVIEALAIVEMVDVNWPRLQLTDETKKMWAREICEAEPFAIPADGYEAVRDLAAHQTYPPAVAEIILGVRGARQSRPLENALEEPHSEGVSFAEFLHHRPDMAERLKALKTDREHADNPITAGLSELLKMSGLEPRKGWRR